MALLEDKIIVNEVAERQDFTPLPAGKYVAMVTNTDYKDNNNKDGKILALTFEIQDGTYTNRKIFENLNIRNKNEIAQRIATEALAELCKALGKETLSDTDELLNKRVVLDVAVTVDKPTEKYPNPHPKNTIKKYLNVNTNNQTAQTPASGSSAAGDTVPRWKRPS